MTTYTGTSGDDTISGGNGADTIYGGDGNDILSGGNGIDALFGEDGNDQLTGDNGADDLTGGAGDDLIDGSNGFDTAYYSGPIDEYSFFSAAGYLHILHLGGAGADGHDQVINVERLVFADRVIDIGSGKNAPVAGDDHVFINEDTGTYSSGAASVKDNDFDFDGDPLTVTGGTFTGTYGTLTLNANGTYSYTLFASVQGLDDGENVTDSFNYTISDNDGSDTGTLVFHIAGLNDAPVANDDTASTTEDAAVSGNVLANDTDIDVEPLVVANPGTYVGAYGTLVLAANGSYTYTPNAAAQALDDGEVVNDSFGYTASDGTASDTATLTVTVHGANDAPVANDDTASTTEDAASVSGNVLANDTDVDVEPLTVANPGTYVGTYGTLTLGANGSYTYVPNAAAQGLDTGEVGQDVFTYSASDGTASDSATLTVSVSGLNDAPVANDDTAATDENTSVSGNVLANDTDVDVETLTVTNPGTYIGAYGTLVLAANGSYTYTPTGAAQALTEGQVVNDVFAYVASDGTASDSATLTVTVTGLGGVPHANDDTASTTEDASVSGNVLTNDTDDENDPLTVSNPGTYVGTYGTLTLGANGSYTYTPNAAADGLAAGETGQDVFTYTATDGTGSDNATLTVTVNGTNDAPTIDAGGTDADGSVTELPDGDPNEGTAVHTDSGAVAFDDLDLSDTHSASFTPQGGGYFGTFTLDPVDQMGDSVGWDFTVSDAALEGLNENEVRTQVYTVQIDDGHGGTVAQDVTITITGAGVGVGPQTVWYIDNSAVGSTNVGTQADPYTSIAAFNAAQGTLGGPQVGHTVYLLAGTGTYAEADGINLLNDQILTGVGQPTIAPLTGDGVDLAQNNTLSGFDIVTASGVGIADGGGTVGNLSVSGVAITGNAQIADIDQGGTLNVTLDSASSTSSSGGAIDLAGVGGSFTVTGATTITGVHSGGGIDITGSSLTATFAGGGNVATLTTTAVNFVGNAGSLELGGGFDIVTTSGAGLNATGGGTVTVTGAGNSVTSTTGTAVTISGTAIGAADVTFESVSANGAASGIVLANTGAAGGFTVTGDAGGASNGSGGTIQNTTGVGISLTNTSDVSLDQINILNGLDDGINGNGVTNFTLTNSAVTNNGNALGEHGADFTNLNGAGTFTNVAFANNEASQISIANSSGTASIALTGVTASSTGLAAAPNGLHGLNLATSGTASADLIVLGSAFDNLFSNSINALNSGSGTLEVTIATTDFTNVGASAINIVQSGAGTVRFYIHDNDTFLRGTNGGSSHTININQAGGTPVGAVLEGAISDNVIGDNSASNSANSGGSGINVLSVAPGTTNVRIDGNDIQGVGGNGINVQMSNTSNAAHTMNATIFDNNVSVTDINSADGIRVVAGAASGDAGILRLDMHDNDAGSTNTNDFTVRQRFATTVQLLNYVGGNTDLAAVQNYLDVTRSNDPTGPGNDWFITTQTPGGGFVNTASVPQPTLPSPLLASGPAPAGHIVGADNLLSQADADQLTQAAIQRWADAGATAEQIAAMQAVSVTVSDMAGPILGMSGAGEIRLDSDGAGYGWFIDSTPGEDSEFGANAGGAAEGRIDALSVIMHELGHQIGLADDYHAGGEAELMHGFIDPGARVLPDGVFGPDTLVAYPGGTDSGHMPLAHPDVPMV